jgi:hypothetical protein
MIYKSYKKYLVKKNLKIYFYNYIIERNVSNKTINY